MPSSVAVVARHGDRARIEKSAKLGSLDQEHSDRCARNHRARHQAPPNQLPAPLDTRHSPNKLGFFELLEASQPAVKRLNLWHDG